MSRANIHKVLSAYAAAIANSGNVEQAEILQLLAAKSAPKGPVDDVVDKSLQIVDRSHSDQSTSIAFDLVRRLISIVEPAARKNVIADLGRIAIFLERHKQMSLPDLLDAAASPEDLSILIKDFSARLTEAMGEEEFEPLLNTIVKGKRIRKPEMLAIAKEMGSDIPASASKKRAINRLLSRHESVATFKAKKRAMAGRSAA